MIRKVARRRRKRCKLVPCDRSCEVWTVPSGYANARASSSCTKLGVRPNGCA